MPGWHRGLRLVALLVARTPGTGCRAQEALAKDEAFAKLMAQTACFAQLMGRNLTVGVEL